MAKVLIVEDEREVRRLLRTLIEAEGHDVIEAEDGEQGFLALEHEPDAIFVDVDMPRATGGQFILRLRQHPTRAETPATFVTAHVERASPIQRAGLAGAAIVHKPFRRHDIVDALRLMLAGIRRRNLRVSLAPGRITAEFDDERTCIVKNLAAGGLFLFTAKRPAVGEVHQVALYYRGVRMESAVRVTHAQADGVGLAFHGASDEFRRAILALVDDVLASGDGVADRRLQKRSPHSAAVMWLRNGAHASGFLRDLSVDGAYVVAAEPPEVGTETHVYLPGYTYSNGDRIPSELRGCAARVVRQGADGFSCKFEGASAEFKMAVAELLRG